MWYLCFQEVHVFQDEENNWFLSYEVEGVRTILSLDEIYIAQQSVHPTEEDIQQKDSQ